MRMQQHVGMFFPCFLQCSYTSGVEIKRDVMFVTSEGLNTKIHVKNNTLITQCKCYRRTHVSVELTHQVGVGTRYYMKCQYDA